MKTKNKTKVEDDWEEFDDCPICQAMKKAKENGRDLTSEELLEMFKEAEKQGAVVGVFPKEDDTGS